MEIKILLIEDNPADARLIKESILNTHDNFHLDWKERLSAGFLFLEETYVDAILVDLNLPDSRGLETFTKINEKFSEKPIIVLTGLNDKELANRAVREGAQDYLIKGEVDGLLLGRCIRYSIERKKNEIALREANQSEQASKTLYKQVVSMISDIVWRYDVNAKGEPVGSYISPVADRMLGLPDGTIGDSFDKYFSYVHPDDLPVLQKMLAEGIQKLEKDKTAEYRLQKVFSNLMDNTIRHGEHSTLVHTYYRTFAKGITIIWEDDGIGIPDDEKKKIFLRGFGKNTGVGLFLCKESLSITGIEIKETGKYGEGARFEITVPSGMWRTIEPDKG